MATNPQIDDSGVQLLFFSNFGEVRGYGGGPDISFFTFVSEEVATSI